MNQQLRSIPAEQQEQNCEAMPSTNADATVTLVDRIKSAFDDALTELIAKRDSAYADATAPLEAKGNALSEEYDELEASAHALEVILPAARRVAAHEADLLTIAGCPQDAKAKLTELAEQEQKPVAMRQRQQEIRTRLAALDSRMQGVAKDVFEQWYGECQPVVRAAEHGLLITLLGGLQESFYQFQASTGTGTSDNRQRPLLNQGHFSGLTADGRSAEYQAGRHWYR